VANTRKDVVVVLLEADASVDDEDNDGKTPLHHAESADIVEILIAAGADVDHEIAKARRRDVSLSSTRTRL
jgi:ankyrin repeat protein